jgi:hypothetical protein
MNASICVLPGSGHAPTQFRGIFSTLRLLYQDKTAEKGFEDMADELTKTIVCHSCYMNILHKGGTAVETLLSQVFPETEKFRSTFATWLATSSIAQRFPLLVRNTAEKADFLPLQDKVIERRIAGSFCWAAMIFLCDLAWYCVGTCLNLVLTCTILNVEAFMESPATRSRPDATNRTKRHCACRFSGF